jgi:Ca2+-binding RTX toxin-like protein
LTAAGLAWGLLAAWPSDGIGDFGSFYANCWFSPQKHKLTVRVLDEEGEIRRRGRRIEVLRPGARGLRPERCRGGRATINNTDRIKFQVRAEGMTTGRISLAGGPFAPGRTTEAESPEIEIKLSIASQFAAPAISGTAGEDHFRGGTMGATQGLNLNAGAEPFLPDVDLRLRNAAKVSSDFDMGAGNDVLDLGGGPEFLGPLRTQFALISLGAGDDRLVGSAGTDFVLASPGVDAYSTGAGEDAVNSQDGLVETVDCGIGMDLVQPDANDVLVGCEELGFVGISD